MVAEEHFYAKSVHLMLIFVKESRNYLQSYNYFMAVYLSLSLLLLVIFNFVIRQIVVLIQPRILFIGVVI